MNDVIVVGSGTSGVNAAYPLAEAGKRVLILDVGYEDTVYRDIIPDLPFTEIRRTDDNQHRYFLGDAFEGIPFGKERVGAQLTPPRLHISAETERLMPVESGTFEALESLALGGLGAGWGAGVFPFDDSELRGLPITRADLDPHYEIVADRIGVSADRDDLLPFMAEYRSMLPPLEIDTNAEVVFERYRRYREVWNRRGFFMGRTPLAVCTTTHRGRGPQPYFDLDFWADKNRSVYRPRWTLEEMLQFPSFSYLSRRFVTSFKESESGVEVLARNLETGETETHHAPALILAAGTLSTARIVLRSTGNYETRVPILTNPYSYVPVINTGMLGREPRDRRHSLAQITAIYREPGKDTAPIQAQYFSYRSLLTFKLLKESPLSFRDSLILMRTLTPLFGILGINQEDYVTPSKYCALHRSEGDEPDRLEICSELSPEEERTRDRNDKIMVRFFRKLGCLPLKRIKLPQGTSIHYAGTFPMSAEPRDLTCDADCLLRGTKAVYLADGSVLAYLPAKGLTFTTMANANRVGARLLEKLG